MLLSEYQAELAEVIGRYGRTDLIVSTNLSVDARSYSYQFQDADARLLFRYDNAAHKPVLAFACQKHLPAGEIIESEAPQVAVVIEEAIQRFLV